MNELEQILYRQVQEDHDYVVTLRRWFHQHPELAREENTTAARIEQELDAIGVPHRRVAVTGVYAEIEGTKPRDGEKRCIVLRADIDGLPVRQENGVPYESLCPGKMHACGHDAHNASLIGAARILSRNRDLFSGKVLFTWQPGEEVGYGARPIIDGGNIDEADRSFGIHMASNVPVGSLVLMPGPNNASVDWFRIRVHGLGAHVSVPQRGVDAAYIASQIVVSAQISAGTAYNVVAQEAELEGTIRVFSPEIRRDTKARLEFLAKQTAEMFGGTAELEWNDNTSALINDPTATAEAQKTAFSLFGTDHVITQRQPDLGGDDFAEYILRVPGCYAYIGSGNPANPNTQVAHHNAYFDIDEDALTVATAMYTCFTAEYLNRLV